MRVCYNTKHVFARLFRQPIELGKLDWQFGDMGSLAALVTLCCMVKSGYEPVFEFGTYRGRTAYNFAVNGSQPVHTLDRLDEPEFSGTIGECLVGKNRPLRVVQLNADSRAFDFTAYEGKMGLVLVDGGHDYATCRADTGTAFRLVRPGGLIVWDDYNVDWPGVRKVIDELDAQGVDLLLLAEESLVVWGLTQ